MLDKNPNASKPSEPPPSGEKLSKYLGGNIGCRDKDSLHGIQRVPQCSLHQADIIVSRRSPPLYCTLALITMQGHENNNEGTQ